MSIVIKKSKKAKFTLSPDGFSVHTFELSRKLTRFEYMFIKDCLYEEHKKCIYKKSKGLLEYTKFTKHGVRILIEHNDLNFETFYLRMIINPRKLIDPESSYLGILQPNKSSVKALETAFKKLLKDTIFESDLNQYIITRCDFCTNIVCDRSKISRELVRAIMKLQTPSKAERTKYNDKNRKKANAYNKHYLKFAFSSYSMVIYDKIFQLKQEKLASTSEKLPQGVLRFEIQYNRNYIYKLEQKYNVAGNETAKLLEKLIEDSKEILTKHFSQNFDKVQFLKLDILRTTISSSKYSEENKRLMTELVNQLQYVRSVDKAILRLKLDKKEGQNLLEKFTKLGISPVPLRKNFNADKMPSVVELLSAVAFGEVYVDYVDVKYK